MCRSLSIEASLGCPATSDSMRLGAQHTSQLTMISRKYPNINQLNPKLDHQGQALGANSLSQSCEEHVTSGHRGFFQFESWQSSLSDPFRDGAYLFQIKSLIPTPGQYLIVLDCIVSGKITILDRPPAFRPRPLDVLVLGHNSRA